LEQAVHLPDKRCAQVFILGIGMNEGFNLPGHRAEAVEWRNLAAF
jgi:hypothetical protein